MLMDMNNYIASWGILQPPVSGSGGYQHLLDKLAKSYKPITVMSMLAVVASCIYLLPAQLRSAWLQLRAKENAYMIQAQTHARAHEHRRYACIYMYVQLNKSVHVCTQYTRMSYNTYMRTV